MNPNIALNVYGLLWDIFQNYQQAMVEESPHPFTPAPMENKVGMEVDIADLATKVDRLALITRAMYELMRQHSGITDQQFAAKVHEIDMRDGTADGRMTPRARPCPQCSAMISPRFNRCLFCGYRDTAADPFNPVK